ncbi:MAG: M48 family metalloprotease, partial [Sedimentisphaerales bacterium]|nr:M48 family metalloprotease [Sedimentisphaerales bacterium]
IAFFFSDKIALMTVGGREIQRQDDPVLYDTVAQLAERANLPMPRVCVSPAQAPNAFATGRSPRHSAVCVTAGLRRMLGRDELAGVIAHELSHIKHRDILISTIAAIFAGTISWIGTMFFWFGAGRDRRSNPLVAIVIMILAPIAAALIQMAISRSREYEADREGAEMAGTGLGLASALRKLEAANRQIPLRVPDSQSNMFIVAPLTGSHVARLFMTHPPIEERINRLRQMEPGLMA